MSLPAGIDDKIQHEAAKFAELILNECRRRDPRVALLALCSALPFAAHASGCYVANLHGFLKMLERKYRESKGDIAGSLVDSRIVIPGLTQ